MAEHWLYYYYHYYFSRTQPANPSSPQTTPATWERYNAWCIIIIIIDGTEGKYSPYFLKDAPAIDSFVEAAGQTVSYYLKAWKIFWTFTLTLTPLSFVARDPLLKPSCAIYLTFEKNGQVEMFKTLCQRHNGPEGWVHLAKVTSWGHITSSNTNLDHISSSKSRLSIN